MSILLFTLFLSACSTTSNLQVCQEADWYELGRREGVLGKPMIAENTHLPLLCQNSDPEKQRILYDIGRKAGLVDYCKPINAFELGKDAREISNVCPPESQTLFVEFYNKGLQVRNLQDTNQSLDEKINLLFDQINNIALQDKSKIELEISKLKSEKQKNNKQVQNIEENLSL